MQTFKWLQRRGDTTEMWVDARLMFLISYKPVVNASWNTYFSSSRVLWSRASRGFPVRSSSCNFGGRFSGKVTSLSSLQLRSTHWRNKWKQGEGQAVRSFYASQQNQSNHLLHLLLKCRKVWLPLCHRCWKQVFAKCSLNFYYLWIMQKKKKIHALSSPHLYPSKFPVHLNIELTEITSGYFFLLLTKISAPVGAMR